MDLSSFPWPKVSGHESRPVWDGTHFLVGERQTDVLCTSLAESAWSKELTALHEAEASSAHPIDVASRVAALESMEALQDRPNPIILDVGCSSGFLVQALRDKFRTASVMGADYLPELVRTAAQRIGNVPFIQFDLRECPLPDQCVDGVTALNVLEHIDDDRKAVHEIYRILKPGGLAHLEVPASPTTFDLYDEVLMHFRRYRLRGIISLARDAGFAVEKATHLGCFVYPAFYAVKFRNRLRARHFSPEAKRAKVVSLIRQTVRSTYLRPLFKLEHRIGRRWNYPFGVRAVLRLKRPE
ncbi:MAG TPA: class I SAM-dependent methyltransferase [Chthoniobacterales bacterium]